MFGFKDLKADGPAPGGLQAPHVGQHSGDILRELGQGADEIAALFAAGTVR